MLPFLLFAQAEVSAPVAADRVVIDLTIPAPCPEAEQRIDTDIMVCAKRQDDDRYRHRATEDGSDATGLPTAAVEVAPGTVLSAETESADLGMARAQRLMVRFKLKF